jgi:hypothetical protein
MVTIAEQNVECHEYYQNWYYQQKVPRWGCVTQQMYQWDEFICQIHDTVKHEILAVLDAPTIGQNYNNSGSAHFDQFLWLYYISSSRYHLDEFGALPAWLNYI